MIKFLEESYQRKLREIENAMIFGEYVDLDDPKQVALAFYYLGQNEGRIRSHKQDKHDMNILLGEI